MHSIKKPVQQVHVHTFPFIAPSRSHEHRGHFGPLYGKSTWRVASRSGSWPNQSLSFKIKVKSGVYSSPASPCCCSTWIARLRTISARHDDVTVCHQGGVGTASPARNENLFSYHLIGFCCCGSTKKLRTAGGVKTTLLHLFDHQNIAKVVSIF